MANRGWKFLFHNVEVRGVQVDLLMRTPDGLLTLIEVKTGGEAARLAWSQRRRLLRVTTFLAQFEPVELQLALVSRGNLRLVPVDALTGS